MTSENELNPLKLRIQNINTSEILSKLGKNFSEMWTAICNRIFWIRRSLSAALHSFALTYRIEKMKSHKSPTKMKQEQEETLESK